MAKTALITGASAGLGTEFAKLFAADGHNVVLVARRVDRLEALAKELMSSHSIQAIAIRADLTEDDAPQKLHAELRNRGIDIDFLVNNAGFGSNGAFLEQDIERELNMIRVNVTALTHLTHVFLADMVKRGSGRVLNIGSTAGFQAGPFMATYYASKAYVISLSEALAAEVKGKGVSVTVSCPGPTETEFAGNAGNDKSQLFQSGLVAKADRVAKEAYAAMMSGDRMVIHGLMNKISTQSLRFIPRSVGQFIAAKLNQ